MKIVVINTLHYGGAGRAAMRLHKGLLSNGQDATLIVKNKKNKDKGVAPVRITNHLQHADQILANFIQQEYINNNRTGLSDTLFAYPYPGIDISKTDLIRDADIINLHWVSNFQSVETVTGLLALGKPVVWTLHDENPYTGGCHYTAGCNGYMSDCNNCPQLQNDPYNLPHHVLNAKKKLWEGDLTIVTPSKWLAERAKKSKVFKGFPVYAIPNSLETDLFSPVPKDYAKKKFGISADSVTILFGAEHHKEKRKGFRELIRALEHCKKNDLFQSMMRDSKLEILTYGNPVREIVDLGIPVHTLGYINDDSKMALAYSAADIFVLPSLEDNLPNTMLESMACGTPVIAFNIGGMPDVIESGKNGILVPPFNTEIFGDAIVDIVLNNNLRNYMSHVCRKQIVKEYDLYVQTENYLNLFKKLVKGKNRKNQSEKHTERLIDNEAIRGIRWESRYIPELFPLYNEYSLRKIEALQGLLSNDKNYIDRFFDRVEIIGKKVYKAIRA